MRIVSSEPLGPEPNAPAPTILIVDDQHHPLKALMHYLRARDFAVLGVEDDESGVACARAASPDLIIMNIQSPRLDCLHVYRRLKADHRTCSIPVVFMTPVYTPAHSEHDAAAGDACCLPVQETDILEHIIAILGQKQDAPVSETGLRQLT
jgi:two-component system, cell cycle response regulator DivK